MKKLIKFPKISQFRQVVSEIQRVVSFVGLDENEEAIYDRTIKKPVVNFQGTVKLHGTNASVCYNQNAGFWTQSRQYIITPESDNGGFASFAYNIKSSFIEIIEDFAERNSIDLSIFTLAVYGEWAGKGIQKNVGVAELEKAFYVFGVKVSNSNDEEFNSYWLDHKDVKIESERVFNILDFKTYSIDVDFNMPQLSQNAFIEITTEVEKECPVAKHFGIENGMGEGVVWTANYKNNRYRFKVKGQKHSVSKVKKLANVDVEKLNSIQEFVNYSVTENRVNQGIQMVFGSPENMDRKKLGDFLRWIITDIKNEESDTLEKNNLEPKEVNKFISFKAKEMFFALEAKW